MTSNKNRDYHILFAVSGHGFGHIGQCAPIIDNLRELLPSARFTVRSEAPAFKLKERLGPDVVTKHARLDIGMVQKDALHIDLERTYQSYIDFHKNWQSQIDREAHELATLAPDLVIANIPYLTLAAARQVNIPAIGFCSLHWGEIFNHYFGHRNPTILQQILQSYNCATYFIAPEPSMPLSGLDNIIPVGPVAQVKTPRRQVLLDALQAKPNDRLILVSLGGMDFPANSRPALQPNGRSHLIVPDDWPTNGNPNLHQLRDIPLPFSDVFASSDVAIAKPGYGTFVEAACLHKPVVYLPRNDWPEVDFLVPWLERYTNCLSITIPQLKDGSFLSECERLPVNSNRIKMVPSGNRETALLISQYLDLL